MNEAQSHAAAFQAAISAQAEAANPFVSAYATANAGSGKTKVLIDRVARLLLKRPGPEGGKGAEPDSILCITYTRAAANEMLTRLFRTLGEWAVKEDDALREALAKLEGREVEDYSREDLRDARTLFARALETPGGLRIETIHAFCARVLRRFPLEAGVAPGFTELEDADARAIWREAKEAAILKAADCDPEALALITREAMNEGASTALDALRSSSSAILRFAEKHDFVADQMDLTLRADLGAPEEAPEEIIASAMGDALPRQVLKAALNALLKGTETDLKRAEILENVLLAENPQEAWKSYVPFFLTEKGEFRKSNPYTKTPGQLCPELAEYFQMKDGEGREVARIRNILDVLQKAKAYARTSALFRVGIPALLSYRNEKAKRSALDFDDLIEKTRELLEADGMSNWVLYKLDGSISHVLIDEAQDTSPQQWELIRALTNEFGAGQGIERPDDPRTMFIVGDEKQSIYSFQGAEPARLLQETRRVETRMTGSRGVDMLMSFRSSPEVLNFVDTVWNMAPAIDVVISEAPPRTADNILHTAHRWKEPGLVELWPVEPKTLDEEVDAWDRPVDILRATSPKARLAANIARAVRQMIEKGEPVWDKGKQRPTRPEDVLILVSKRQGGLFESLISALKSEGLPVAGADRLVLTDFIGVQDCLNLMRFATLDIRDLTVAEILRGPFVGLVDDDAYLFPLASGRQGESLWERIKGSADEDVRKAAAFLQGLLDRSHLPPYEFLSHVLDRAGKDGLTGWEKINARLGTPARDPIEALMSKALAHDSAAPSSIQSFVAAMEAESAEIKRDLAEAGHEIRVMTVHGAKGLQAPVVILPDTTFRPKVDVPSLLASASAIIWSPRKDTDTDVSGKARALSELKMREEHRRLLYVALTRAQDRLIIAGHWHGPTGDGKTGYDKNSWYALCDAAMVALAPDQTDGIRRYGVCGERIAETTASTEISQVAELPDWVLRMAPADPLPRRVSAATSLLGPKTRVVAPFDPAREARLKRGRTIHALLQYLPELPADERQQAADAYLARDLELTGGQRQEMKAAAFGVIDDPDLADLFLPGGRAEATIIGAAPELPQGTIINGRVDRLIVLPEKVLIIDFKTDQPAPGSAEDVAETYVAQMAAYWAVLRSSFPGRRVIAALCWTDGPRLMQLPEAQLLAVLEAANTSV